MSKKYEWVRIRYNLQSDDFFLIRTTYVNKVGPIDLETSLEDLLNEISLVTNQRNLRELRIDYVTPIKDLDEVLRHYLFDKKRIALSDSVSDKHILKK